MPVSFIYFFCSLFLIFFYFSGWNFFSGTDGIKILQECLLVFRPEFRSPHLKKYFLLFSPKTFQPILHKIKPKITLPYARHYNPLLIWNRSWLKTADIFEEFPYLVHKLSVILNALANRSRWKIIVPLLPLLKSTEWMPL